MAFNPYASPPPTRPHETTESNLRRDALFWFRATLLSLLLPAFYNYFEFDRRVFQHSALPAQFQLIYRAANLGMLVIGGLSLWFFGLQMLDSMSRLLHRFIAPHKEWRSWQRVLFSSARRAFWLSVPGSLLWIAWVYGFYRTQANFFVLSCVIGFPTHLLAAGWYIPLAIAWYRTKALPDRASG